MAANEPAYLPVGTDVSAKYRGAFCEAKVKKLVRAVKCKVILKETSTSVIVSDDNLKGTLKVGATVEIKHPETGQVMEGTVSKLTDQSMYTVVFDDGDEKTLRRTQLCLKGEKHFIESETLDNLPLSHPEHFGTPVLQTKSRKRTAKMGSPGFNTLFLAQEDTDSSESSSEDNSPKRASYRGRQQELVGKVMYIESGDKRKGGINPVLVVLPDAASVDLKTKDHLLVKSFKDGKFSSVLKKELKDFTREIALKNEDKSVKTAIEKALLYYDNHEIPSAWKRDELLGSDDEMDMDDDDSSDDEPSEEKDRFVAQLYKFMDDRGTPINKGPSIGNRDLNLYKLFRVVQNLGGYNRENAYKSPKEDVYSIDLKPLQVTNQMKWRLVYSKMGLPQSNTASHQIKNAYKKFLHAFEDFYRKLGSTMGTISRPGRSRHSSGRSILSFRGREKDSPKSPRSIKSKDSDKEDSDRGKAKSDGESHSEDGKDMEEVTAKEETPGVKEETERKERTTPRRMLRDDLKEAKEKEKEAKKKKEEREEQVKLKKEEKEDVKSKKDDKDEGKSKRDEKDEPKGKKEDKKAAEEERKSLRRDKQDDKADSKKEEVRSETRETRRQKDKQKDESKVEKEKPKKKEEEKEEAKEEIKEEEDKSVKKPRVTRRKSGRGEEGKKDIEEKAEEIEEKKPEEKKPEEKKTEEKKIKKEEVVKVKKEDKKEVKKDEKKEVKKEEKKDEKEKKKEEKPCKEKKTTKEKKPQEEEESEENDDDEPEEITLRPREEYPMGTKLKVRYGRGRNQKIYEAKVVEANKDGSHKTYLVHYAGWNNRYDEWVKPDRIISVVNKPDVTKLAAKKAAKTPSPKQTISNLLKKRGRPPSGGGSIPSPGGSTSTEFRTPPPKSRSPAPGSGQSTKTRPTRSNSMENQVVEGLPPKRLTRRSSGITESSDTISHASDESSDSDSDDTEQKIVVVVEEHKFDKDEDESDMKESEHDTSLEDEVLEEEQDTSIEEKDTDISREEEPEVPPVEEDSLLHCSEELLKSEEEDVDLSEELITPQLEPESEKEEEKVEEIAVMEDVKEDSMFSEEPQREEFVEKKEEEEDKNLEKDSAPELVAEKPFKESVLKGFDGRLDSAAEEARFEASEALLQMPILHEVFKKVPEEPKEIVPEVKKPEVPPMPEIKKVEPEVLKKEKEVEKKERGRKQKKDFKEGKKLKAAEPVVLEPKPVEPHVMTPQEARMKAAMDLYDFQGFEEPEPEELVLRRDKNLLGRRLLPLERDIKPDPIIESVDTEKKKVKKKVKKKTVLEDEAKKDSEIRDWFTDSRKDLEKKETDVKKDSFKESAKGKGLKGEKCAKKDTKKTKDIKVDSDIQDVSKEKKEKRPRSRSSSPVETCSKALKTEPLFSSPKPSTSSETVSMVKDQPQEVDSIAELNMNTMLVNTPPTTPEHESNEPDCLPTLRIAESQAEVKESMSVEQMAKLRSESPSVGECSGSSYEGNENNSALPTSESSNDVELSAVAVGKRKRDSLHQTPSKKKRVSKGGKGVERKPKTIQGSDSDETNSSKHPSPVHIPGPSSPMKMPESAQVTSPRPPKYNFNLEEGKYFEGEKRIAFLIDKMQEIRKIYMNLKQEVACIDRRRKRAKRKERENSQSSQVECESS